MWPLSGRKYGNYLIISLQLFRKEDEILVIRAIADNGNDDPLLNLIINRYKTGSWFPGAAVNLDYIRSQKISCWPLGVKFSGISPCSTKRSATRRWEKHLALSAPNTKVFQYLRSVPGSEDSFRLPDEYVDYTVFHGCGGEIYPFSP